MTASNSPPLRVLIVDDHPDIREMLVMGFKWRGHQVESADSVEAALALAASYSFDVVVSDWSLPDGTGADLMKTLKELYQLKGVVLSAYSQEQIGDAWRHAGFQRVVSKFSDLDVIGQTVEDVAAGKNAP